MVRRSSSTSRPPSGYSPSIIPASWAAFRSAITGKSIGTGSRAWKPISIIPAFAETRPRLSRSAALSPALSPPIPKRVAGNLARAPRLSSGGQFPRLWHRRLAYGEVKTAAPSSIILSPLYSLGYHRLRSVTVKAFATAARDRKLRWAGPPAAGSNMPLRTTSPSNSSIFTSILAIRRLLWRVRPPRRRRLGDVQVSETVYNIVRLGFNVKILMWRNY